HPGDNIMNGMDRTVPEAISSINDASCDSNEQTGLTSPANAPPSGPEALFCDRPEKTWWQLNALRKASQSAAHNSLRIKQMPLCVRPGATEVRRHGGSRLCGSPCGPDCVNERVLPNLWNLINEEADHLEYRALSSGVALPLR